MSVPLAMPVLCSTADRLTGLALPVAHNPQTKLSENKAVTKHQSFAELLAILKRRPGAVVPRIKQWSLIERSPR